MKCKRFRRCKINFPKSLLLLYGFVCMYIDCLGIDNLGDVLESVWDARVKWFNIGLKLGISVGTLNAIKKNNNQDPDDCLTAMLEYWLNNGKPKPSWAELAKALKSPMVGYKHLAEQLPPPVQ